jgi:Peptidase of plants and bacteria
MKENTKPQIFAALAAFAFAVCLQAAEPTGGIQIVIGHNDSEDASGRFKVKDVRSPAISDAANKLKLEIVAGEADPFGGGVDKLTDGKLPAEEDEPGENFFFQAGTDGGRLLLDLGSSINLKQINTYSWHPTSRGPQVYNLYASDGAGPDFTARPSRGIDPLKRGWTLIAKVNTRSQFGSRGGQYGVSVSSSNGPLGKFRYVLFECLPTQDDDAFGNTFYSEIDVIDADALEVAEIATESEAVTKTFDVEGGKYQITINASGAPDLADWGFKELAPVLQEWYPKLIAMLPSEGFAPSTKVSIKIEERLRDGIPAWASGSRISLNGAWFKKNLKGEAIGAVVHETVHVLQRGNPGSRRGANASPFPGWLVEGIPDYIRFFKFEPQNHGADDIWLKRQNIGGLRYDKSYRISANFLEWVSGKYDPEIVVKLNAAGRLGSYTEQLWKDCTAKSLQDLGDEWLAEKTQKFGAQTPQTAIKPADSKL